MACLFYLGGVLKDKAQTDSFVSEIAQLTKQSEEKIETVVKVAKDLRLISACSVCINDVVDVVSLFDENIVLRCWGIILLRCWVSLVRQHLTNKERLYCQVPMTSKQL